MSEHTAENDARLCWRHWLRLYVAAFGGLLDLTGRTYPREARGILADARTCPRCTHVTPPEVEQS